MRPTPVLARYLEGVSMAWDGPLSESLGARWLTTECQRGKSYTDRTLAVHALRGGLASAGRGGHAQGQVTKHLP